MLIADADVVAAIHARAIRVTWRSRVRRPRTKCMPGRSASALVQNIAMMAPGAVNAPQPQMRFARPLRLVSYNRSSARLTSFFVVGEPGAFGPAAAMVIFQPGAGWLQSRPFHRLRMRSH